MMAVVWRCVLHVALITLLLMVTSKPVNGDFMLMVNLVNYTNPSGLCAECGGTTLDNVTTADQLLPVCCDEATNTSNCDNTGDARCDTRFRWTIRPFGTSLKTRPASIPNADNPPYFFTNCALSPTSCPFSEMSATFSQGPTDFLGVTGNPLNISKLDFTIWTGQIQFYIEPLDSGLPNIIDSLLVNLDSLQLGGNFTEEMMFTGFHNISTMTMSFRVECSPGFCGPDCTTTPTNNPLVAECQADGSVTCVDSKRDPSLPVPCSDCLYNLNNTTNCSTCLQVNYDPDNNCMTCLPNYDIATNCSMCTNRRYDPANNCQSCLDSNFNPLDDCTSCLLEFYDPQTSCTQCLPDWDTTSGCTQCLLPNRDPTTNCSLCLQPDRFTDTNCTVCALPERDPATLCETCLTTNYDPSTNCTQCLLGWDNTSGCSSCLAGFTGSNCERDVVVAVDPVLVGSIAGGVGGALLLIIVVLVIIVCVLMCQVTKRGHVKFVSDEGTATNAYDMSAVGTGTRAPDEHKFQNPLFSELDPKTGTGSSDDHAFTNFLYESTNLRTDKDSELRRPDITPPSHTVKTDTSEFTSTLDSPSYDIANYRDGNQPSEEGIYDTADHSPPPFPVGILDEDYAGLCQPTATNTAPTPHTLDPSLDQPVYDEAFPPTLDPHSDAHPSKSAEAIKDEDTPQKDLLSSVYDDIFPPELPVYDVANNNHPQQLQPKATSLTGSVYNTANYSPEQATKPGYETSKFLSVPKEFPSHTYDYANANKFPYQDTPLSGASVVPPAVVHPAVPPAVVPSTESVYTNTTPGQVSIEAESHYDIGQ